MLRPGLIIASDSCSLIFLNRLGLLERYAAVHSVMLPQAMYDEITRTAGRGETPDDRTLYRKLFAGRTVAADPRAPRLTPQYAGHSPADRALIDAYCSTGADALLTDDKALCLHCRRHAVPYINTPVALFALLYNNRLSKGAYLDSLRKLYGFGRYAQFVRDCMDDLYTAWCRHASGEPQKSNLDLQKSVL